MFTLFFGCQVGGAKSSSNMEAPCQVVKICTRHYNKYLKLRNTRRPKTWRNIIFIYVLQHQNFLTSSREQFLIYFFSLCDSVNHLYSSFAQGKDLSNDTQSKAIESIELERCTKNSQQNFTQLPLATLWEITPISMISWNFRPGSKPTRRSTTGAKR